MQESSFLPIINETNNCLTFSIAMNVTFKILVFLETNFLWIETKLFPQTKHFKKFKQIFQFTHVEESFRKKINFAWEHLKHHNYKVSIVVVLRLKWVLKWMLLWILSVANDDLTFIDTKLSNSGGIFDSVNFLFENWNTFK